MTKATFQFRRWIGIPGPLGEAITRVESGGATFNDQRTVETHKAGYVSQVTAERDRAKFPRKRKSRR